MKSCSKCGKNHASKSSWCNACRAAGMRAYRLTPEGGMKVRQADKLRAKKPVRAAAVKAAIKKNSQTPNGKAALKKADHKWKAANKSKIRADERKRRATDPKFRLAANLRRMLRLALKRQGCERPSRTEEMLGCSYDMLRRYLQQWFRPGMTWDNLGEWQIDHIVPVSSAKDLDDVLRLNRYTNLQPMWAQYNRMKQDMMPNEWYIFVIKNRIDLNVRPCRLNMAQPAFDTPAIKCNSQGVK